MPRSFATALRGQPLFFAPVPPSARASPERLASTLASVAQLAASAPRIDAFNIPELVDENHDGRPYYRTADPRGYAAALATATGREVVVTKIVAHLADERAVRSWAESTVLLGLRHTVLVGGSSRYVPYPGPPVAEANAIVRPVLDGVHGTVGNIAIPQRTGEAHRMLAKTRAGASFFTTQLAFDAAAVVTLLGRYDRLCREASVVPATVLVSVAPVGDEADAEFVRWLGADLPEAVERGILDPEGSDISQRSIENAQAVWAAVREAVERGSLSVPVGVNVEQLSARHLGYARKLVDALVPTLSREPVSVGPLARPGPAPVASTDTP